MNQQPFERNYQTTRPYYWNVDILWVVLAEEKDTNGNFSCMWELCPRDSGPPPHYHEQDEAFYVIDGEITYLAGGHRLTATTGSFVWIPRTTIHSFRVDSDQCTLLNFYTPAGFEQSIVQGASVAPAFSLPPKNWQDKKDYSKLMHLFARIGMHVVKEPDTLRLEKRS